MRKKATALQKQAVALILIIGRDKKYAMVLYSPKHFL